MEFKKHRLNTRLSLKLEVVEEAYSLISKIDTVKNSFAITGKILPQTISRLTASVIVTSTGGHRIVLKVINYLIHKLKNILKKFIFYKMAHQSIIWESVKQKKEDGKVLPEVIGFCSENPSAYLSNTPDNKAEEIKFIVNEIVK